MTAPRIAIAALAALAASAGPAAAAERHARTFVSPANLTLPSAPFRTTLLSTADAALPRSFAESGGVYKTRDGMSVRVTVSDYYLPNAAADQALVDFFGALLHGSELAGLTAIVVSPDEIKEICGAEASGCYSGRAQSLVVAGETTTDGIPVEHVMAHEYGHHVAANRRNAPWEAVDWGTKRWATYMGVCSKERASQVFPGDEGDDYALNPGEGWAEVFRLHNANLAGGWADFGWNVVSSLFFPDATATSLLQQDVLQPWAKPTTARVSGRLAAGTTFRYRVQTPLDGVVRAGVSGSSNPTVRLSTTGARALTPAGKRPSIVACGDREVIATVRAQRRGAFSLTVTRP